MDPPRTGRLSGAGRPMISREFIKRERRRAFASAAADLTEEFGSRRVTVDRLVGRAASSRGTFYELFSNRQDCLGYAIEEARERLLAPVRDVDTEKEWAIGIRDAIGGFYGATAEEPNLAKLLLVHSFAVTRGLGEDGLGAAVSELRELIARGRSVGAEPPTHLSALLDEYYACGILSVATRALFRDEAEHLPHQTQEVAHLVASAYLDISEVERILPLR